MNSAFEIRRDITKEEVVRRELNTVIRMFFSEMDAISIHVLVSAAYEIVHILCEKSGIETFNSQLEAVLTSEGVKTLRKIRKTPYHFFKHAKRDSEEQLAHFDERINEITILEASMAYQYAFGQVTIPMVIFRGWAAFVYPHFWKLDPNIHTPLSDLFGERSVRTPTEVKAIALRSIDVLDKQSEPQRLGILSGLSNIKLVADY